MRTKLDFILCSIFLYFLGINLRLFAILYILDVYRFSESMIIDMDYISVKAISEKWSISELRIQKLCEKTALRVLKNLVEHR